MSRRYYTLLCSLPHLPHFLKAKQAPLTPVLLEKRLRMLEPQERAMCDLILKSLPWHHLEKHDSGAEIAGEYEKLMAMAEPYPDLERTFRVLMEQRIVAAWYRSRIFGIGRSQEVAKLEGSDAFTPLLAELAKGKKGWLAHRFPWLEEMRRCMEEDRPYDLTLLMMELEWKEARRLAFRHPFGFEEVAAYLMRWMILQMRFAFDTQKAVGRFITLTSEIVSEYRHTNPLFD